MNLIMAVHPCAFLEAMKCKFKQMAYQTNLKLDQKKLYSSTFREVHLPMWYLGSALFTGQRRERSKITLSASQDLPGAAHSSNLQVGFSYSFDPVPHARSWISQIRSKDRLKEQQVNRQMNAITGMRLA